MKHSREIFDYAMETLSQRRSYAKEAAAARKEELYPHIPRLAEIERELSAAAPQLIRAVMGGGGEVKARVEELRNRNLALQDERARLLASVGLPADFLEPAYHCRTCKDSGYVDGAPCRCLEELLQEEKLRRLNSVSSLSLASFDQFRLDYYPQAAGGGGISPRVRMEEIFDVCREYAQDFDQSFCKNLLMTGNTGLGKTHLSLAIASQVIGKGFQVVYGSVQDLFRQAEEEKFRREGSSYATLESLLDCDLLILDDLGSEFASGFSSSMLYNLVNTRLNCRRPTIISTNLTLKGLKAQYADRVVSRLMGGYNILVFLGSDVRTLLAQQADG